MKPNEWSDQDICSYIYSYLIKGVLKVRCNCTLNVYYGAHVIICLSNVPNICWLNACSYKLKKKPFACCIEASFCANDHYAKNSEEYLNQKYRTDTDGSRQWWQTQNFI